MATGVYKDTVIVTRLSEVRALDGKCATEILPGTLVTAKGDLSKTNSFVYVPDVKNHTFTPATADTVRGLCIVLNAEEDELRNVRERGKTGRKSVADPFPPNEQIRADILKAGAEYTFIIDDSVTGAVVPGTLLKPGANGKLVLAATPVAGTPGNEMFTAIESLAAGEGLGTGANKDLRRIACRVL